MRRFPLMILIGMLLMALIAPHAFSASPEEWKINRKNFSTDTAGYASPNSVVPGEQVDFYLTCPTGSFVLSAFRMGYFEGKEAEKIWSSESLPCLRQSEPVLTPQTNMSESHWKISASVDTTDFPPGFYLIKIITTMGHQSFIPLVVRENNLTSRVVISIPTLTSLAYNSWRGPSAYRGKSGFSDRARVLSFDRPMNLGFGSGKYLNYVHPLLVLTEKLGLHPAYVTDVDIASKPGILSGAAALVSGGHDEYWTVEERNSVIRARSEGTNLLFFGANVAYWRVRLAESLTGSNRRVEIYKSSVEDPKKNEKTIKFRDLKMSESDLTGQKYNCFPARGIFQVANANSFVFRDTGAQNGSQYLGITGLEVDRVASENPLTGPRQILGKSDITCGTKVKSESNFIFAVSASEAGTISVGTMRWVVRGLSSSKNVPGRTREFVRTVTSNILLEASKGPLGNFHNFNH